MFDSLKILDLEQIWADPDQSEIGPRLHHQEFGFFRSQCLRAQPTSPSSWCTIQDSSLAIMEKFRNFQFSVDPPIYDHTLIGSQTANLAFFAKILKNHADLR